MKKLWIILFGLLWMLTSCAPPMKEDILPIKIENSPIEKLAPTKETEVITMTTPISPTPLADTNLQALIDRAKDDLATRLSIDTATIDLIQAKAVNWADRSLGCPQPDMMYAQVITPGYLIRLETTGKIFEYHAGRGTEVVYCENPQPPVPSSLDDT